MISCSHKYSHHDAPALWSSPEQRNADTMPLDLQNYKLINPVYFLNNPASGISLQ
jgi:hypothetical protein